MIVRNPASLCELPKQTRREMQSLTTEQAQAFLASCRDDRYGLVFEFALVTGMRPEEYCGLKWTDIDLRAGTATVQRVISWSRNGSWSFGETKTSRSRRTVPLTPQIVQSLREHKREQSEQRLRVGAKWNDHELVFTASHGEPISLRNLQRRHFKPLLKGAGLPDIRLYD